MRSMGLMLCGLLAACATTRLPQGAQGALTERLETLEDECGEARVLALCDLDGCELFWCLPLRPESVLSFKPSHRGRWNTSVTFVPPKPNELLITDSTRRSRATWGMQSRVMRGSCF